MSRKSRSRTPDPPIRIPRESTGQSPCMSFSPGSGTSARIVAGLQEEFNEKAERLEHLPTPLPSPQKSIMTEVVDVVVEVPEMKQVQPESNPEIVVTQTQPEPLPEEELKSECKPLLPDPEKKEARSLIAAKHPRSGVPSLIQSYATTKVLFGPEIESDSESSEEQEVPIVEEISSEEPEEEPVKKKRGRPRKSFMY